MTKATNILLSLLIASTLGLTGCGGDSGGDSKPEPEVPEVPEPEPNPDPDPEVPVLPPVGIQIDVNLDTRHIVGGIDKFDRRKFIGIHAALLENEWHDGFGYENKSDDLITDFLDGYDVYLGRNTGGISWELRSVEQDAMKPGFVSESDATARGNSVKNQYKSNTDNIKFVKGRQHEDRSTDQIIGAQQHPFWPDGTKINSVGDIEPWAFSQADTASEPFGTATGHYFGQYLSKYFGVSSKDNNAGEPKPQFIEVMNEPLYVLVDEDNSLNEQQKIAKAHKIFEFHNVVADEIRKTNPEAVIGGYTVAFPNFEEDNFTRWEDRDKAFIDIAGEKMDFVSLHLYDFPAFKNSERYRRGGNLEATLDMLENYTNIQHGKPMPMLISEYGAQVHTNIQKPWSKASDWENVISFNGMLMGFMERPDLILKSLPFIVVKGEWGRTGTPEENKPYQSRLMRQENEPASATGDWVYSDMIHFYDLWSDVNGTRVDTWSSEVDIQVDGYVDGNKAYVILNSLEFSDKKITLNTLGVNGNDVTQVNIKHYYNKDDAGYIQRSTSTNLNGHIILKANATMVLEITYASDLSPIETNDETKYYAETYKQAITANNKISFDINDVVVGSNGEAVIRMGVGRNHGLSLKPEILLNGKTIEVPDDFRGDDQYIGGKGRETFFGLIEVPVELADLQADNTIEVTFADNGGFVSSMTLQVFNSTRDLKRTIPES